MTEELRSHLWECAEILRGSAVDRTDWKAYILPLLFFKRISDVWDEETADTATLGNADPVDFPEVHRFNVPEDCHWRDVRPPRSSPRWCTNTRTYVVRLVMSGWGGGGQSQ
jgi:type I restriction enzyme M protein